MDSVLAGRPVMGDRGHTTHVAAGFGRIAANQVAEYR